MQLIALALGLLSAAPAEKVAVLDFGVEGGVAPVVGRQMTARLADLVGRRPSTSVISPDSVRALLENQSQRQLLGCGDDRCFAEIGLALGVDLLIQGRVTEVEGSGYLVSLSAVKANAEATAHVSESWRGEAMALLELLEPMVDRLLAAHPDQLFGSLEISGAIDGSRVLIDAEVRGTAPTGQMGHLSIGAHQVTVALDGYLPFQQAVIIKKDLTTAVVAEQKAEPSGPLYAKWWFWGIAAVAIGGTATAIALSSGGGSPSATGINISLNADRAFTGGR